MQAEIAHDENALLALSEHYSKGKHIVYVESDNLRRFLVLCTSLAACHARWGVERKLPAMVELGLEAGELILRQVGTPRSGNELILAAGLSDLVLFQPVLFLASELTWPLNAVNHQLSGYLEKRVVVAFHLDFLDDKVLVLRFQNPQLPPFKWVTKGF
jgi:hypothetical protein